MKFIFYNFAILSSEVEMTGLIFSSFNYKGSSAYLVEMETAYFSDNFSDVYVSDKTVYLTVDLLFPLLT